MSLSEPAVGNEAVMEVRGKTISCLFLSGVRTPEFQRKLGVKILQFAHNKFIHRETLTRESRGKNARHTNNTNTADIPYTANNANMANKANTLSNPSN